MENLFNCNGLGFRAKINGEECEGKIRVEHGVVYLCQNKQDGYFCRDKFGYKYSWYVGDGSDEFLARNRVTEFQFLDMTSAEIEAYKDFKVGDIVCNGATQMKVIYRSGDLVVLQLENGRASKNYTVTELYDDGWRLKSPRPEGKQECEEVALTPQNPPHFRTVIVTRAEFGPYRYIMVYEHTIDEKAPTVRYNPLLLDVKGEIFTGNVPNGEVFPATDFEKKLYKQTLEANGYEFDDKKNVVHKYQPKKGDLVFEETCDRAQKFIELYDSCYNTPSVKFGLSDCKNKWHFHPKSGWPYTYIRPATSEEAAMFARIMSENGYEYDPEKKKVRKNEKVRNKRWRAKHGETYLYVSEGGSVEEDEEYGFEEDDMRHKSGNYFRLSEREAADEAAAEFRKILCNR